MPDLSDVCRSTCNVSSDLHAPRNCLSSNLLVVSHQTSKDVFAIDDLDVQCRVGQVVPESTLPSRDSRKFEDPDCLGSRAGFNNLIYLYVGFYVFLACIPSN